MLSPAVLFAAICTGLQVCLCYSNPNNDLDVRTILELAKQQALHKQTKKDLNYKPASEEEHKSQFGSLTSHELLELFQKSSNNHRSHLLENDEELNNDKDDSSFRNQDRLSDDTQIYGHYGRYEKLNENRLNNDDPFDNNEIQSRATYNDHDARFNEQALEELLSQNVLDKQSHDHLSSTIPISNLAGSYELGNVKPDSISDGYSKVYVILNPEAIEKSKNKDKLNSLLAKILSLTASSFGSEKRKRIKERRYKGFPVKTGLIRRRARRESREMYAGNDLEDEDYKPKRSRIDRGGGGGGGRTAIPYIRHRGDIYERDS